MNEQACACAAAPWGLLLENAMLIAEQTMRDGSQSSWPPVLLNVISFLYSLSAVLLPGDY